MREALTLSAAAENEPFPRILVLGLLVEISDAPGDFFVGRSSTREPKPSAPASCTGWVYHLGRVVEAATRVCAVSSVSDWKLNKRKGPTPPERSQTRCDSGRHGHHATLTGASLSS
jgi:hypothetical protein